MVVGCYVLPQAADKELIEYAETKEEKNALK
jgi:hypothetical protein